jgi:hypothetical protein
MIPKPTGSAKRFQKTDPKPRENALPLVAYTPRFRVTDAPEVPADFRVTRLPAVKPRHARVRGGVTLGNASIGRMELRTIARAYVR